MTTKEYDRRVRECKTIIKMVVKFQETPPWELDKTDIDGMIYTLSKFSKFMKDNSIYHLGKESE